VHFAAKRKAKCGKTQRQKHKNAQKVGDYAFSFRLKTGVLYGEKPLINGFLGAKSR
jgi:hypothetical protein